MSILYYSQLIKISKNNSYLIGHFSLWVRGVENGKVLHLNIYIYIIFQKTSIKQTIRKLGIKRQTDFTTKLVIYQRV